MHKILKDQSETEPSGDTTKAGQKTFFLLICLLMSNFFLKFHIKKCMMRCTVHCTAWVRPSLVLVGNKSISSKVTMFFWFLVAVLYTGAFNSI
jgi:hypothetical protein